jgi:trehalose 6-phosphate phosphatase
MDDIQRAIAERPAGSRLVVLSDYDGTLAEFDPDPTIPRPTRETGDLLCKLSGRNDMTFGIVSGRRISDLRTRTQVTPRSYLAGLHGLEIEVRAERWQHPDLEPARKHVRALYQRLSDLPTRIPGLLIEDKDASMAVHVRGVAPEFRASALAEADRCAAEWVKSGKLRRLPGSFVLEFLPNIAAHKGDATKWIAKDVEARCKQPAWTVFIGDDITDEDAFKAIKAGISVLVGSRATNATHRVANTGEVCRLLAWLTQHTSQPVSV